VNTSAVSKAIGCGHIKETPSFNSVLIYEDLTSGERAWNFYEKLSRRFQGDFDFSHLMWSFWLLNDPQTRLLAARSAADAHLIILSFSGTASLPADVKTWVRQWLRLAGDQSAALVTLIDRKSKSEVISAIYSYLRRVTGPRKIDFFPHRTVGSTLCLRPE
jgi:hypothetical protein